MQPLQFARGNLSVQRVVFSAIVAFMFAFALPALPQQVVPALSSAINSAQASASYCGSWADNPYQDSYGAYGTGGVTCPGGYPMDQETCLRKQRSLQPDEDTSCAPIYWGLYYSWSSTAYQCDANSNYRTRSYVYYDSTGNPDSTAESSWVDMSVDC